MKRHHAVSKHNKSSWGCFGAYLEQARNYFRQAQKTEGILSSLFYYYCFLNLSKACLFIRNPKLQINYHHGLVSDKSSINQNKLGQFILGIRKGVFKDWYYLLTKHQISEYTKFKIIDLFSYASDTVYQLESGGFGQRNIFHCKARLLVNTSRTPHEFWLDILLPRSVNFNQINVYYPAFSKRFEELNISSNDRDWVKEVFQIEPWDFPAFTILESRKVFQGPNIIFDDLNKFLFKNLKNLFSEETVQSGFDMFFCNPVKDLNGSYYPMNEPIGIYMNMFFWGSMVRYHPETLMALGKGKEMWIIEDFIDSTAHRFIRFTRNYIFQQAFRIGIA